MFSEKKKIVQPADNRTPLPRADDATGLFLLLAVSFVIYVILSFIIAVPICIGRGDHMAQRSC